MKICLIGAGRIGAVHAIAIASDENANLHSVVDFHQESAEKLANKYNAITLSMDEAFENNEIDAFIIASSTSTHADLIEKCAKVGKPVFAHKVEVNAESIPPETPSTNPFTFALVAYSFNQYITYSATFLVSIDKLF